MFFLFFVFVCVVLFQPFLKNWLTSDIPRFGPEDEEDEEDEEASSPSVPVSNPATSAGVCALCFSAAQ